eukprot:8128931-Pyramimonas_sp.AAC.1
MTRLQAGRLSHQRNCNFALLLVEACALLGVVAVIIAPRAQAASADEVLPSVARPAWDENKVLRPLFDAYAAYACPADISTWTCAWCLKSAAVRYAYICILS